jgi:rRNA maturation RNase YbeY
MNISFHFLKPISLTNRGHLKKFIERLSKQEKKKINTLAIIFCSDDYLLQINRSFLSHNYYTDIITFDLSEKNSQLIDAEIYISIGRVRENAELHQTTYKQELHRVVFHGVLHLCGYKDKSAAHKKIMRNKEDQYLSLYFK